MILQNAIGYKVTSLLKSLSAMDFNFVIFKYHFGISVFENHKFSLENLNMAAKGAELCLNSASRYTLGFSYSC
jgi:hypothetical protein